MSDGRLPSERPKKAEIEKDLLHVGVPLSQVEFSVDEHGVDNAHIRPGQMGMLEYDERVRELISYAAHSGAAMGFDLIIEPNVGEAARLTAGAAKPSFWKKLFGLGS